jgi:hypothetical protein
MSHETIDARCRAARSAPGLAVLLGLVTAFAAANADAGTRDTAPRGVSLEGQWQLDPLQSEDSHAVRAVLREQMRQRMEQDRERHGGSRGGPPRDSGPMGGDGRRGAPGGGAARGGSDDDEQAPPESRGLRHERDGPGRGAPPELDDALATPEHLEVRQAATELEFRGADNSLSCEPGEKVSVTDGAGTGVRTCGWDGKAFVITLKRDRGPKRVDRFELDATGQRLIHTTRLSGGRMPDTALRRVYGRASPR